MGAMEETRQVLAAKFQAIFPHLDERQRRLLMGAEARALGHGGIRAVARAAGVREATVSLGVDELESGAEPLGRARRPGGEAITTVFRRFTELGSARQVMLSMRDDGLALPRWRAGGRIEWVPASYGAVIGILANPCYAGAFAFGRTRNARPAAGQGRPGRSGIRRPVPMDQWEVLITGHHRGYITWEEYLGNQQILHANCPRPGRAGRWRGPGRPRAAAGPAALRPLRPDDAHRI